MTVSPPATLIGSSKRGAQEREGEGEQGSRAARASPVGRTLGGQPRVSAGSTSATAGSMNSERSETCDAFVRTYRDHF